MRRRIPHRIISGVEEKYCKQCDKWYPLSDFNKKNASYDGLETRCIYCARKKSATFRKENPEFDKEYQQKHAEELKKYKREYYLKNKTKN